MDQPMQLTEREEVEALLPWYVTGKLNRVDRERVERSLAQSPELSRQLAMIEDDRRATIAANERIALPHTLSADSLIELLPPRRSGLADRLLAPLRKFFTAPTAESVQWAAAVVAVAFVLQGLALAIFLGGRPEARYETASGGPNHTQRQTTLLVRFVPGASLDAIGEALETRNMRIVDGPKPGGLYVVAIGPAGMSAADRDQRASELRSVSGLVALVLLGGEAGGR